MRSSLASRLKALSPPQLALVAMVSLALAGGGIVAAVGPLTGPDVRNQPFTAGDQDLARGLIVKRAERRERVRTQERKVADGSDGDGEDAPAQVASSATKKGALGSPNGDTPAPAGGGGASGAGGPVGDTGTSGPKGNTGGAGPKGDPDAGNGTDAAGPSGPGGDTGAAGPSAPLPSTDKTPPRLPVASAPVTAPAVFVVKDANGTTAGTLLGDDPDADWLTFSYKDRMYLVNAQTGALDLPKVDTSYVTDHCTGTPYASLSRPATSVLRSSNPSETGIYEFGEPRSVDVRSIWQPGEGGAADVCLQYVYTTDLAPLNELPAGERPPALSGPLKAVPAG